MDHPTNKPAEEPKVVSLFGVRKQTSESNLDSATAEQKQEDIAAFNAAMRKNMENAERLRKERLKANQGVLKSYRIKN